MSALRKETLKKYIEPASQSMATLKNSLSAPQFEELCENMLEYTKSQSSRFLAKVRSVLTKFWEQRSVGCIQIDMIVNLQEDSYISIGAITRSMETLLINTIFLGYQYDFRNQTWSKDCDFKRAGEDNLIDLD